jgi:hypothetical protein
VCLHEGEGEARFSGWLRIPVRRRPGRRRLRALKKKLLERLGAGLLPVDGRVVKLGVRRCRPREAAAEVLPLPVSPVEAAAVLPLPGQPVEAAQSA